MAIITNKSIFYHIPKTGGTWVSYALKYSMKSNSDLLYKRARVYVGGVDSATYWKRVATIMWGGLSRAHQVPCHVAKKHKDGLFSYAFVRQPLSWHKSWWLSRKAARDSGKPWRIFLLDFVLNDDFEKFVTDALDMFPEGALTTLYQCFLGENGDALDFVGKQENLREDLIKALTLSGENFKEETIRNLQRFNARAFSVQQLRVKNVPEESFDIPVKISSDLEKRLEEREKWVTDTFYKKW